ncbi:hypothetical protein R3P38DRAFT_3226277 [Favolaschia claudopus]|uniref:Uncharacterized protein n=1 Tax=Favolaschia claudopus TaxID=2862362 RepID=A0AAV9ZTR5_9AGAR
MSQKHHYWQQVPSSSMFRPVFFPSGVRIQELFSATVHCFLLQHGLHPISIWLLLSFIHGKDALLISKRVLQYMDPGVAAILAPWYDFLVDSPVPPVSDPTHPIRLFIFEHWIPSIQPNLIWNNRTPEVHNNWVITAFSIILLGHPHPWDHSEYLALEVGFNKAFGRLTFDEETSAFLVTIHDRRVHRVEEVADHLSYYVDSRHSDLTTPYFMRLFRLRVDEYLRGSGHPVELRDQIKAFGISDEEFIATVCFGQIFFCGVVPTPTCDPLLIAGGFRSPFAGEADRI